MVHINIKQINSLHANTGGVIMYDGANGMKYSNQATSSVRLPSGTTEQRPSNVDNGSLRFNTDLELLEYYEATSQTWIPVGGGPALLGTPADGSLINSRYTGGKPPAALGLTPNSRVVDAYDDLNEIVGLLLPDAPPNLNGTFTVSGSTTALVASGATSTSGVELQMPSAGTSISRITSSLSTSTITAVGPGDRGTIKLYQDGSDVSGESLAFTTNIGDAKTTGVLRITNNVWGGFQPGTQNAAPPGFYEIYDVTLNGLALSTGYHTVRVHQIDGSNTYQTNAIQIMKDDMTNVPTISSVLATENTPVIRYSSGIKHYDTGSTFDVSGNVQYIAGQCYLNGWVVQLQGDGNDVNINPGSYSIPNPVTANYARSSAITISNATFTISGNVAKTNGGIVFNAQNLNGSSSFVWGGSGRDFAERQAYANFIIWSGTIGISDASISGPATANRIYLTDASKNTDTPSSLANSSWVSTQDLSAAGYTHEATIVAGVLGNDVTNYSQSYIPTNVTYANKNANQYITYKMSVAGKSNMTINITGTYSGIWVALNGISTDSQQSPNAVNGVWWSAQSLYNGSGIPGRNGDSSAGCAVGSVASGNGSVSVTFGTASSSNAINNEIYVRIRLGGGNKITAISLS